jgi:hypothetical protein
MGAYCIWRRKTLFKLKFCSGTVSALQHLLLSLLPFRVESPVDGRHACACAPRVLDRLLQLPDSFVLRSVVH